MADEVKKFISACTGIAKGNLSPDRSESTDVHIRYSFFMQSVQQRVKSTGRSEFISRQTLSHICYNGKTLSSAIATTSSMYEQ